MSLFTYLWFHIPITAALATGSVATAPISGSKSDDKQAQICDAVAVMADEVGCYFTIERIRNTRQGHTAFEQLISVKRDEFSTVDELIEYLQAELSDKGIAVVQAERSSNIFHLIEDPLVDRDGYVMDKRLDFAYSGRMSGLADAIGERLHAIGQRRGGFQRDMFDDWVTEVELDVQDRTVREILTQAPPLERYGRILWIAEVDVENPGLNTVVQFSGPAPMRILRAVTMMGEKLDCYFTIERLSNTPQRRTLFEEHIDLPENDPATTEELIEYLRKELRRKGIMVLEAQRSSNVIHLIEEPLADLEDYAMDQRLDFTYVGRIDGLLPALTELIPQLQTNDRRPMREAHGDTTSMVDLEAEDRSVREILTLAPPLEDYRRIIWVAETDIERSPWTTYARFGGPIAMTDTSYNRPRHAPTANVIDPRLPMWEAGRVIADAELVVVVEVPPPADHVPIHQRRQRGCSESLIFPFPIAATSKPRPTLEMKRTHTAQRRIPLQQVR